MLAKRLSRGTFRVEVDEMRASNAVQISAEELAALLSELSLTRGRPLPS